MALSPKQRGVLGGMTIGLVLTLAGILAAPFIPGLPRAGASPGERLGFALRWDLLLVLCLIAHVGALARHRFRTPEDIDGSGLTPGSDRARVLQATLQNTLEQVAIACLVHLIWAVSVPLGWTASLPIAAGLFVLGRIAFARGYVRGAPGRAFGFAATFYPSVVMTLIILVGKLHGLIVSL